MEMRDGHEAPAHEPVHVRPGVDQCSGEPMRSEQDKMLGGERYDPLDPQRAAERRRAPLLFKALNDTRDDQPDERARLIRVLIHASVQDIWIEPPFYCDDGSHITLGDKVFFNFNYVVLDVAPVRIGSGVLIGPAV